MINRAGIWGLFVPEEEEEVERLGLSTWAAWGESTYLVARLSGACAKVLRVLAGVVIMTAMSDLPDEKAGSSLWTTPASAGSIPLREATVDMSVSPGKLREAVDAARDRAATFSGRITEEFLRKSF